MSESSQSESRCHAGFFVGLYKQTWGDEMDQKWLELFEHFSSHCFQLVTLIGDYYCRFTPCVWYRTPAYCSGIWLLFIDAPPINAFLIATVARLEFNLMRNCSNWLSLILQFRRYTKGLDNNGVPYQKLFRLETLCEICHCAWYKHWKKIRYLWVNTM